MRWVVDGGFGDGAGCECSYRSIHHVISPLIIIIIITPHPFLHSRDQTPHHLTQIPPTCRRPRCQCRTIVGGSFTGAVTRRNVRLPEARRRRLAHQGGARQTQSGTPAGIVCRRCKSGATGTFPPTPPIFPPFTRGTDTRCRRSRTAVPSVSPPFATPLPRERSSNPPPRE